MTDVSPDLEGSWLISAAVWMLITGGVWLLITGAVWVLITGGVWMLITGVCGCRCYDDWWCVVVAAMMMDGVWMLMS